MLNDSTYLGIVQDVQGSSISVALDANTISGLAFIDGHGYRIGQIGSFVRIPIGFVDLYGVISQIGAGAVPERLVESEPHGNRWMSVQLIGEGHRRGRFSRGLSQYPTVGDKVHLVTEQDLSKIYGQPDNSKFVRIGSLASSDSIPALIDVDKLVTRHSAIVGTTGAGKSTTVAGLLTSLSNREQYPSARILILDIHGEYASALKDRANVFRINPNEKFGEKPLYIPYWALNFDELLALTVGALDDTNRGAFLEKIMLLKSELLKHQPKDGVTEDNLTVDTPIPFSIHKLWLDFYTLVNGTHSAQGTGQSETTLAYQLDRDGNKVQPGDALNVIPPKFKPQSQAAGSEKIFLSASTLNIRRQLESLASKLRDPRLSFLFRPGSWFPKESGETEKDLDILIKSWLGGEQPISILDLSGVPSAILIELTGVLLRIIYDSLFWARNLSEGGRERPLLVVLEEAHAYLSQGDINPAAQAVRKIVKEGRKYGIGAMIVSQRPSEIDSTILSQCGTIFAMRLANPTDRSHVTGVVTDNLDGLLSTLPILRTGEAIVVGEAVHLPMRVFVDCPPFGRRPDSSDPIVYAEDEIPGGWNRKREEGDYKEMIAVWRKQEPRSPKIVADWSMDRVKDERNDDV